jgi:hypothetical protein
MRIRKASAFVVVTLAAVVLPAVAAAGAQHFTETFTDQPVTWFGPDECVDTLVTGTGLESGTVSIVETPNGGTHVRVDFEGTVDLYEATNPDPEDPQPGAFVGTWTYEAHVSDQAPPGGGGAVSGVASGPLVLADGTVRRRQVSFHLTFQPDGPPKVFFAKFVCSG